MVDWVNSTIISTYLASRLLFITNNKQAHSLVLCLVSFKHGIPVLLSRHV